MRNVLPGLLPPVLLGIFFTLSLYSRNISLVPADDLWLPLLLSVGLALALFGILFLILRSSEKAGILSFLLVGAIFSYGYSIYISIILLVAAGFMLVLPALRKYLDRRSALVFSAVALGLVMVPAFGVVKHHLGNDTVASQASSTVQAAGLPDIYYIIFDSYAGEKSLQEIGFDNSDLYNFLKQKNFYIAGKSHCNYPRTYLSLASALNMDYLDLKGDNLDYGGAARLIEDNRIVQFLKSKGYLYYHVGAETFLPTAVSRHADKNYQYRLGNPLYSEFSITLYETTVFNLLGQQVWNPDLRKSEREGIIFQLDTLRRIALQNSQTDSPVFTFCHILLPHHNEFLFNADGSYPAGEQLKMSIEENYINKITYLNQQIKELVNSFLADKDTPPIIVLQSDEGISTTEFTLMTKNQFNVELDIPPELIRQRACVLNAVYLPDGNNIGLYPSVSSVNIFRLIFNHYFDTDYEILPDKFYFPRIYSGSGNGYPSSSFYDATDLLKE
jgi:hypothetical protein